MGVAHGRWYCLDALDGCHIEEGPVAPHRAPNSRLQRAGRSAATAEPRHWAALGCSGTVRPRGVPIELDRVQAEDGERVSGWNRALGNGAAVFRDPTAPRGRGSTDERNRPRPWLWEWRSDSPTSCARTSSSWSGSLHYRYRGSPTTRVWPPGRTTRSLHRWRCERGSRDRRARGRSASTARAMASTRRATK